MRLTRGSTGAFPPVSKPTAASLEAIRCPAPPDAKIVALTFSKILESGEGSHGIIEAPAVREVFLAATLV
jgi:hypothetical protein